MLSASRLLLLLIVAVVAGAALANGPTALPHDEHYPAAYLHKVGLEEARNAEALRVAYLLRGREVDENWSGRSTDPDDWLRLGSHPFLARVFPGTAFYATSPYAFGTREFAAVCDGKFYFLPKDVCRLLYGCGMRFEDSDMPTWLRAIAILCSEGLVLPDSAYAGPFYRREAVRRRFCASMYRGEMPYLPELVIESVRLDTGAVDAEDEWLRGKVHHARIRVRRDGKQDSLEVEVGVWRVDGRLVRGPTRIGFTTRISEPQSCLDGGVYMDDLAGARKSRQGW